MMQNENPEKTSTAVREPFLHRAQGFCKRHWKLLAAAAGVLVIGGAVVGPMLSPQTAPASANYIQQPLERRDIVNTFNGSGTIQAADAYTVRTLVKGTVLTADFELGDEIEKGTVLYTLDSADASAECEKAQLALEEAKNGYENALDDQTIRSPIDGTLTAFLVGKGDAVQIGQELAVVRDRSVMLLGLEFPAAEAAGFSIGQKAQVLVDTTFEALEGTVRSVSGTDSASGSNLLTRTVTIAVSNPGGLTPAQAAAATVNGVGSIGSAHFRYQQEQTITAAASGTVAELCAAEGASVRRDTVLLRLSGRDLDRQSRTAQTSVRSAQLNVEAAQRALANYTITSPIRGTVVEKRVKAGDTVGTSLSDNESLCTIYDMSYLEMNLAVDELKIRSLKPGQTVEIRADAVPGEVYTGVVTSVLVAGTTTGGTTTYPVTVRIDRTGELRPGMNATVQIQTEQVQDVLAVPNAALLRGSYVLVTTGSPSAANADPSMTAPEGYVYVPVRTGISDDQYIQILSGLTDGDVIGYDPSTLTNAGYYGGAAVTMTTTEG